MEFTRITIIKRKKPQETNINEVLQWFGASLGLFNPRDKDKSCFRIFIALIKQLQQGESINSDELAAKLNLSRGTVVHHLNKLMESGIVDVTKNRYHVTFSNMKELVDIINGNITKTFKTLRDVGDEIDKQLRL